MMKILLGFLASGLLLLALPRLIAELFARPRTYNLEAAPSREVAIVFGAGLRRDGTPTSVLRERVETAADLYFSGKVQHLLLSGDNRFLNYNEPGAMAAYALSLGVPEQAIVLDYAGRSTYDTCYRARHIFQIQGAILVTQRFHLPRSLYTCNTLGIRAVGVAADRFSYRPRALLYWNLRELAATLTALWEIHISQPLPVLGDPEPIS